MYQIIEMLVKQRSGSAQTRETRYLKIVVYSAGKWVQRADSAFINRGDGARLVA